MIAVDRRDSEAAQELFEAVAAADSDIDTVQQASLETDRVVLDLRRERRESGLDSCSG